MRVPARALVGFRSPAGTEVENTPLSYCFAQMWDRIERRKDEA